MKMFAIVGKRVYEGYFDLHFIVKNMKNMFTVTLGKLEYSR